jgi:hypothetical protein
MHKQIFIILLLLSACFIGCSQANVKNEYDKSGPTDIITGAERRTKVHVKIEKQQRSEQTPEVSEEYREEINEKKPKVIIEKRDGKIFIQIIKNDK